MTEQQYAQPQYQQGYPQQAPQVPAQGGYPQQPQMPQQPYGGQQAPQQPPATQGPPPAQGSLDAFYSQPSVGWGPALTWKAPNGAPFPDGTSYTGIVAREVTSADIEHQTKYQSTELDYYRDGRPKFVMKVPLLVQPSQQFPDGRAQWYVAGAERDELARAMHEAGAPAGPPEAEAVVTITLTGHRRNSFGTQSKIIQVGYQRPQGAASGPSPQAAPADQGQQAPPPVQAEQPAAVPQQAAPAPQAQAPAPQQQVAPAPQAAPQGQAQPPAPSAAPGPLTDDQQALLARLTGQQL